MSSARRPVLRRRRWALLLAGAVLLLVFLALGVFQIKRLAWKEDLLARVARNVHATPASPPWGPLTPAQLQPLEYRRVTVTGHFVAGHETLVTASTVLGGGYWVLTPLQTTQGHWVWVNRGFVTPAMREPQARPSALPTGEQTLVGLLRLTEPGGTWLRSNQPQENRWYSRDVQAMSVARGLTLAAVPPYFIDLVADTPAARQAWPRPGLTVLHFNNNHLVYALTWFALAAMTAGALGYLVVDERRLRRLQAQRRSPDESHFNPRH